MNSLLLLRLAFVILLGICAFLLRPFHLPAALAALLGGVVGALLVSLETRARKASPAQVLGAAGGILTGLLGAYLAGLVLNLALPQESETRPFLQIGLLLFCLYFGGTLGAARGRWSGLPSGSGRNDASADLPKILDTSVIIDGRIADIVETGFIDGLLIIPQFVLRELQLVADSPDSARRNRGRRGLDILQRIQKMPHLRVQIVEDDFPQVREVDLKLIELAKVYSAKIITNDFNLNKVAQLRGVSVLNINELANTLKPVVLPGEVMRVFILKEGKEYNQGVAYLDDGTMVVVDNARRMISKTIDVTVTSVLQTTAGKMIFGKYETRAQSDASSGA